MNIRIIAATFAVVMAGSVAFAAGPPAKTGQTVAGPVLTDEAGMTLYTFDKDGPGTSNCTDACAQNWPPLMAAADSMSNGDYTMIKRADGAQQWAYKGKPLYRWVKDTKPGDTTGDGFKDIWHTAKP
ncbi:MAG: hypothetical protein J0626_04685 [Rhodospirillaceae bacterium]|nr:hypothetical protein [Rhodospirillaceae bacterium]